MDPRARTEGVWQERRSANNPGRRATDRVADGGAERRATSLPQREHERMERPPDVVMPEVADHHDHAWNRD